MRVGKLVLLAALLPVVLGGSAAPAQEIPVTVEVTRKVPVTVEVTREVEGTGHASSLPVSISRGLQAVFR